MNRQHITPQPLRLSALLLVLVFLFIKLSPQYFAWQYPPASKHAERVVNTFRNSSSTNQLLVVIDKSITEDGAQTEVPAIQFSGLLLFLFLGSFFIFFNRIELPDYTLSFTLSNVRLARLGVFRL